MEFLPCVLEVLFSDFCFEYFLDNRQEVRQGAHSSQWRSIGGADKTAYRGEHERVLDFVRGMPR